MKEDIRNLSERLRQRGLTCNSLSKKIKQQQRDAVDFEKLGFNKLANTERAIANQLRMLKDKVCRRL